MLARAQRQQSDVLVVSGDPGIGKSALCAWAIAAAGRARVLRVRGSDSQADLPFAGLLDLFANELDRIAVLPEPQSRALAAALAQRGGQAADRFATGAAVLSLLAALGTERPVLAVVDDAQWLDASSADALLFAARRLQREGVAMLLATRPGSAFDADRSGLPCLRLDGLDGTASRELLRAAHGELPDTVAQLLVERTYGNPLALLEVPRLLNHAQLQGEQVVEEPLALGPALERALLLRLGGLPEDTRRALLIAAAAGGEQVQPVIDALALRGQDRSVLEVAEVTGAVSIAGERLAFRHPLLRSAIYHGSSAPERRAAHDLLARVTTGDAHAWHLAQATVGHNEAVAAAVERAAREARQRGAPSAAAAAFERAARLSPPGDDRARRLTEAAREAYVAGRPAGGMRLIDAALADADDPIQRAGIEHVRGRILLLQGRTETATDLLIDSADRIRDADPERAATMLAEACHGLMLSVDVPKAVTVARDAFDVATRASPAVQAFAGITLAGALVLSGERAPAGALLDRFLPLLEVADPLTEAGLLVTLAALAYFWIERHDVAATLLARLLDHARRASAPAALMLPLCCRAELDLRTGRWQLAAARLEEALLLGEELTQGVFAAYAPECLARLAAAAGDEEHCRAHAARALSLIDKHRNELGRLYVHSALGLLELGLGRTDAAISELEPARDLVQRHGLNEPNVVHWQADLAEAYIRAGDTSAAEALLDDLERHGERTQGRWARGTAARCRGLLADEDQLDACFSEALEHLEAVSAEFEVARTQLCYGERLRRAGRRIDARRALRLAVGGFDRLGAEPWAARAREELAASGASARRSPDDRARDELTPH
ncbi:MAG TPA: ATP-binding protein, partial [Solirubrobacter sp.]|nr:ATP-binding protein [Solirubrobacter sp.]